MARNASMRLGALNLLVLVIAISLAVLSVLSLVSALASESLSDRQRVSMDAGYAEETAAQYLLADIDGELAYVRDGISTVPSMLYALENHLPSFASKAASLASSQEFGLSITAEVLDTAEFTDVATAVCAGRAASARSCVGGVSYQILSEGGKTLDCLIGINADGTYEMYAWKTAKVWLDSGTEEKLWSGN